MSYWATKEALKEMIRDGISKKDITLDLLNHKQGNFLNKLANVIVEPGRDNRIEIRYPMDQRNEKLIEIEYIDGCWQPK